MTSFENTVVTTAPGELPAQEAPLVDERFDTETQVWMLDCGDKRLDVILPSERVPDEFITVVVKKPGDRISGATTALYTRAQQLMQQETDDLARTIKYEFSTLNPQMMAWGREHGQQIFGWTVDTDDGSTFVADTVFTPQLPE